MKPTYVFGTDYDEERRRLADATFYQFPITLGYAITIHKSQGMSLDRMILDCDGIFADGQFYVGISRARSLEGLSIINFEPKYIKADQDAVDFYLSISGKPEGFIYEGVS
jgi:ATP-dependent DNA helicase PIF1